MSRSLINPSPINYPSNSIATKLNIKTEAISSKSK